MKIELKRRLKPLKVDELIDQGHPLFIGKILGREARQKHDEVGNRLQYIEKHLEPPLISSSYQSICWGLLSALFFRGLACGDDAGLAFRPAGVHFFHVLRRSATADKGEPENFVEYVGNYDEYERKLIEDNFILIHDPYIREDPPTPSNPAHVKWLIRQAKKYKADLIIIDTYKASFDVDENDNDSGQTCGQSDEARNQ